jgi:hypothetical protein
LARHTSLRIGGPADYFVIPASVDDILETLDFVRDRGLPWIVLGNGTNVLFPDEGYRGVIIKLGPSLGRIEISGDRVRAPSEFHERVRQGYRELAQKTPRSILLDGTRPAAEVSEQIWQAVRTFFQF